MKTVVMLPFKDEFRDVYEKIEAAANTCRNEAGNLSAKGAASRPTKLLARIELFRVDQRHGATDIVADLLREVCRAQLCIADISGNNPNVLWEVGYAMALRKATILLTDNIAAAPFDLKGRRAIVYERSRLSETLEKPLTEAIRGIFTDVPEVFSFPSDADHAQLLATSVASPAYFLDSDFNIQYMNEAAVALFNSNSIDPRMPEEWVGHSLDEFISSFSDRLLNLASIERNLQIQKERLRRAGNSMRARPVNIERVIFDTVDYGVVRMQKTGVAVRDPSDGRIVGWVVSFNVVQAKSPLRFAKFHERHEWIVNGKVFGQVKAPLLEKSVTNVNDSQNAWIDKYAENATLSWATNYSEKQQCFEYMAIVMVSDRKRFGLDSVTHLRKWFFDYASSEYLALNSGEGRLIGVLRLHCN